MSFERSRAPGSHGTAPGAGAPEALAPGKQTLTEQLAVPVQRRANATNGAAPTTPGSDVHTAAAHGTSGATTALPYRDQIQRSFGRHDVGGVRAHVGGKAAEGAGAMGASAYAVGDHVAFAGAPDLHTAAHEAAHVVQQRGGVQLKGGVGEVGDSYERHADAVADLVVQGKSSEALLDTHAGGAGSAPAAASPGAVQRLAFVEGKQIKASDKVAATDTDVKALVTDKLVHSYESDGELVKHAHKQTDYLGNLASDGTWMRFEKQGLNILGERHDNVSMRAVTTAVHATTFINERLSNDRLTPGSKLEAAYRTENAATEKEFGIDKEENKQQFGAESLFPKMGWILTHILPRLESTKKDDLDKLTTDGNSEDHNNGVRGYDGQPAQRYLKMAWAYARDIKAQAQVMESVGRKVTPVNAQLAAAVKATEADLDAFLTGLAVDGFLGDALEKPEHAARVKPLVSFIRAFVQAMVDRAVRDPSSRLTADQKIHLKDGSASDQDKEETFKNWRNFEFEDSVKAAAARHVRYAGMGVNHMKAIKDHLPSGSRVFDMDDGPELQQFRTETGRLKKLAGKP